MAGLRPSLLVALALLASCGPVNQHWSAPIDQSQSMPPFNAETLAISEAAFRYIIAQYEAERPDVPASCIGIGHHEYRWRGDAPAALISRISKGRQPVLPASKCPKASYMSLPGGEASYTPAGMTFYLESIDCLSKVECRVQIQYNGGFDDLAGYSLSLVKRAEWVITERRLRGIS